VEASATAAVAPAAGWDGPPAWAACTVWIFSATAAIPRVRPAASARSNSPNTPLWYPA